MASYMRTLRSKYKQADWGRTPEFKGPLSQLCVCHWYTLVCPHRNTAHCTINTVKKTEISLVLAQETEKEAPKTQTLGEVSWIFSSFSPSIILRGMVVARAFFPPIFLKIAINFSLEKNILYLKEKRKDSIKSNLF